MGEQATGALTRFMDNCEPVTESGCWIWMKTENWKGYGIASLDGKNIGVHRLAYKLFKGDIPSSLFVCHTCDVRCCVNPDHLWIGTYTDNNRDMMSKRRFVNHQLLKTHCKQGHAFTPENTRITKSGWRACRACTRIKDKNRPSRAKC